MAGDRLGVDLCAGVGAAAKNPWRRSSSPPGSAGC